MTETTIAMDFRAVRLGALERLRAVIYEADGEPVLCRWQGDEDCDVPLYCNLHDHLRALEDLLAHGTWCDGACAVICEGDETLYRYFTLVAWAVEQCLYDMEVLLKASRVEGKQRLRKDSRALMGFVNNVWKHRDSGVGKSGVCVHGCLHHGPYYFGDDPTVHPNDLAADCVLTIENYTTIAEMPCSALVPRLQDFVNQLGAEMGRVMEVLDDSGARKRVTDAWGDCSAEVGS